MKKVRFSVEQIRTFIVVAQTQHISQAATTLFLTQGAVTQQVRHFERALGVQLVERSGRGVRLTAAGRAVAAACSAGARSLEGIEETASLYSSVSVGSLELGASPTAASCYLPALLTKFISAFPQVEIKITPASSPSVAEQVITGVLDCGLIESPTEHPTLVDFNLIEDEVAAVVRRDHPLADLLHLVSSDLDAHRYIAREEGSAHELVAKEVLGDAYGRGKRLQVGHLDAVRGMVLEGLGFAVLPTIAVAEELQRGTLRTLPIPTQSRWIRAVRRGTLRAPTLEAFWDVVTGRRASDQR
jgi:DNA-binding transcriptional LysR family regulator